MVNPRRSWLPPTEGWSAVQEWHSVRTDSRTEMTEKSDQGQCCKRNLEQADVWEETLGATGMQHWNKGPRCNPAAASEEWDNIRQLHQRTKQETRATSGKRDIIWGLRTNSRVEGPLDCRKWVTGHCVGLAPSKRKEVMADVGAINVGALTILGTCGSTNRRKMMVINLDQLAPYEGTTWDEWL
jgi:hypothetical protein